MSTDGRCLLGLVTTEKVGKHSGRMSTLQDVCGCTNFFCLHSSPLVPSFLSCSWPPSSLAAAEETAPCEKGSADSDSPCLACHHPSPPCQRFHRPQAAVGNLRARLLLFGKRRFLRMPLFGNATFCHLRSFAEPELVLGGVDRSLRD